MSDTADRVDAIRIGLTCRCVLRIDSWEEAYDRGLRSLGDGWCADPSCGKCHGSGVFRREGGDRGAE